MKKFLKVMAVIAMTVAVAVVFCSCTEKDDTSRKLSNNFEKEVITENVITENIEVETIEPKCVGTTYYWGSTVTYWDWSK